MRSLGDSTQGETLRKVLQMQILVEGGRILGIEETLM